MNDRYHNHVAVNVASLVANPAELVACPLKAIKESPVLAASSFMASQQFPNTHLGGLLTGSWPDLDIAARVTEATKPLWKATDFLAAPHAGLGIAEQLEQLRIASAIGTVKSIADTMNSASEEARKAVTWKPPLIGLMQPSEVTYTAHLPEIERSVYAAARPGILSFAQQLRNAYDFTSLRVFVHWPDTPRISDFFVLDFEYAFDFDIDAPLADEPVVTEPLVQAPITSQQPLHVGMRQVVLVAGHPYVVRVVSAGTCGAIGWGISEALGYGALGAWVGGAMHELMVVIVGRALPRR